MRYTPSIVPGSVEPPELKVYLDQEFRRVAAGFAQERLSGILLDGAASITVNDTTETAIVGYLGEEPGLGIDVDATLGTLTLPPGPGVVRLNAWISLGQTTNTRNFTTQLKLEVDGSWQAPILASGYIPQNGNDVRLGIGNSLVRRVTGSEVLRLGLILDGASPATFDIDDITFEISYEQTRG